ncbi:glycosyl transferase [Leptospira gomenensis]|uniref:Glycosyl transferase n=1 Tax=Leptospira gomenensis TaxID=2484974 RepID=A0A5F1Z2Q1_9LEPT|nr:glycosyltransferase family 2 protein [Leptospira gomenensis]TGK35487.1 glycosyl transferase [Leptospira gomenensis]TGK40621.1 glycosyl transferase [Leptospira gomenensis]TGK46299.1 glycosyl transferase [Leptospira gomenensis]TGK66434.1 glycosyl transferase [Leptospira gomenensis]
MSTASATNPKFSETKTSYSRQLWLTRIFLILTAVACVFAGYEMFQVLLEQIEDDRPFAAIGQISFFLIIALLTYGNFVYQFTRIGYFKRLLSHSPANRDRLEEAVYQGDAAPLAILVPSYKEELDIVRETLLSAALQDYPNRRIVLLIDDPPQPKRYADFEALRNMRNLPQILQSEFDKAASPFLSAKTEYENRKRSGITESISEIGRIVTLYETALSWFETKLGEYDDPSLRKELPDHTRIFMRDRVFETWSDLHRSKIEEWNTLLGSNNDSPNRENPALEAKIEREYNRLVSLFSVRFSSFERKSYVNLSHLPNKAMNLNSYIDLLGKRFREREDAQGIHLEETFREDFTWEVPAAEFLITLDADSTLLPDYAIKLVQVFSRPGFERIAVVQTPYSSVPGAPNGLERMAGATTDIQYQIHQGFTHFGATFWVGANAMLRHRALLDICTFHEERGFKIRKYIQDNTVIEDTESSIDLLDVHWNLFNYPERLAYSATPPDFGSLLIQRRRWANGGLIILPKLIRHVFSFPWRWAKFVEGFFRVHYLGSIAAVNVGLVILMGSPLGEGIETYWIALSSIPYFVLYGMDLVRLGYRWIDVVQIYSLNLLLIPVNLAGVFMSVNQAITGKQIPFSRTPKVIGRTALPGLYVISEFALFAQLVFGCIINYLHRNWIYSLYNLSNALLLGYAIVKFIGIKSCWEDLLLSLEEPQVEIVETVAHLVEPGVQLELESAIVYSQETETEE